MVPQPRLLPTRGSSVPAARGRVDLGGGLGGGLVGGGGPASGGLAALNGKSLLVACWRRRVFERDCPAGLADVVVSLSTNGSSGIDVEDRTAGLSATAWTLLVVETFIAGSSSCNCELQFPFQTAFVSCNWFPVLLPLQPPGFSHQCAIAGMPACAKQDGQH